jgi:2-polyprenyl-6-methoxyphenol hydroxylase-like FAD-dependent oxidoreductase
MSAPRSLTLVGGGLAGLALGAALARGGAEVTLYESGRLPRHRVCGEFLSGLLPEVVARLRLGPHLRGAAWNRTTGWHAGGRLRFAAELPQPAAGLSRPVLEERLRDEFISVGGTLRENTRLADAETQGEGVVWCAGRRPNPASPWLGLKIHCRNLRLGQDLEVHLGRGGYVGTARIEDGRVNVCGLFRRRPGLHAPREEMLLAYLRVGGLEGLADRVAAGEPDPASAVAVSGLDFSQTSRDAERLSLGDHHAPIPPYTGHGMAMALESAAEALAPLLAYARGELNWARAVEQVRAQVGARQDFRLRCARWLHPWLLQPLRQRLMLAAADARVLPFGLLYRVTHGRAESVAENAAARQRA